MKVIKKVDKYKCYKIVDVYMNELYPNIGTLVCSLWRDIFQKQIFGQQLVLMYEYFL